MSSYLDGAFGTLVQALKDKGIYDNALLVFISGNVKGRERANEAQNTGEGRGGGVTNNSRTEFVSRQPPGQP